MKITERGFSSQELKELLITSEYDDELFALADKIRRKKYGNQVFVRGLIEFSNYCRNNCYYCGIRCGNSKVDRYRLSKGEILKCCHEGYELGFRTFVLQGGEDPYYTDEKLCSIVRSIAGSFPDCAVTLSAGERSRESYQALYDAGARRYLLRHETASDDHYSRLHPDGMILAERMQCLYDLKEIGFQVGSGFMVGSPYQTAGNLVKDIEFLKELDPDMIGIGPFIHHKDTPFGVFADGSMEMTLRLIAVLRIIFPHALIPSTTALGTIHPEGRERGLKAGANVVMPNLSPELIRDKYELYESKKHDGEESAQGIDQLIKTVENAGYEVVTDRGDVRR